MQFKFKHIVIFSSLFTLLACENYNSISAEKAEEIYTSALNENRSLKQLETFTLNRKYEGYVFREESRSQSKIDSLANDYYLVEYDTKSLYFHAKITHERDFNVNDFEGGKEIRTQEFWEYYKSDKLYVAYFVTINTADKHDEKQYSEFTIQKDSAVSYIEECYNQLRVQSLANIQTKDITSLPKSYRNQINHYLPYRLSDDVKLPSVSFTSNNKENLKISFSEVLKLKDDKLICTANNPSTAMEVKYLYHKVKYEEEISKLLRDTLSVDFEIQAKDSKLKLVLKNKEVTKINIKKAVNRSYPDLKGYEKMDYIDTPNIFNDF